MRQIVADIVARRPVRAGAFIVTLYGDVVVPRGGMAWIGNVIEICRAAGISETHVRTAVSRLVASERLVGMRRGRRSFYRLADAAHDEFAQAARIVYGDGQPANDGNWTFVALDGVADRAAAAAALSRARFVRLSSGLMVAPGSAPERSADCDGAVFFNARRAVADEPGLKAFVAANWPLDDLHVAYADFLDRFKSLGDAADRAEGEVALLARLLLVHEYRQLVLNEPGLPVDALPDNWPGQAVHALFAAVYRSLSPPAERYVATHFVSEQGSLPQATAETRQRLQTLQD